MSVAQADRDEVLTGALALQRVLALEGRNALARVELAASELDRFALSPTIQDRVAAIRDAVGELDGLLDKIERLADPARRAGPSASSRPADVLPPLFARVGPALAARGVVIAVEGGFETPAVALPAAVLERLVLLWVRLAVAASDESGEGADGPTTVLRCSSRVTPERVELILDSGLATGLEARREAGASTSRGLLDRSQPIELDVELAEWRATTGAGAGPYRTLVLPRSAVDA